MHWLVKCLQDLRTCVPDEVRERMLEVVLATERHRADTTRRVAQRRRRGRSVEDRDYPREDESGRYEQDTDPLKRPPTGYAQTDEEAISFHRHQRRHVLKDRRETPARKSA